MIPPHYRIRVIGLNVRLHTPQPFHEFVQRAFAAEITSESGAPQDFDPREVAILAQPLCDLRRVLPHDGRAAARSWSPPAALSRCHLMEPSMVGLQGKSDTGIEFPRYQ